MHRMAASAVYLGCREAIWFRGRAQFRENLFYRVAVPLQEQLETSNFCKTSLRKFQTGRRLLTTKHNAARASVKVVGSGTAAELAESAATMP
jgi:hypothetical protein